MSYRLSNVIEQNSRSYIPHSVSMALEREIAVTYFKVLSQHLLHSREQTPEIRF
jgi:hypothetical protein